MQCDLPDPSERLLEALYGEADSSSRREFEAHLAACAACRQEWDDLRQTRRQLGAWKVPEFGRVKARAYTRISPLWRLAAAAVLLFAAGSGLGVAGVELRRDPQGWSLTFGRAADDRVAQLLAQQEARTEQRIQALGARVPSGATSQVPAVAASADSKAVLEEVRRLIHEGETRQNQRMVALVTEYHDRAEAQSRYDLARMAAGLSYLNGKTGQHMARTTQLVGSLLDASQQPQR
jgi:Putative zinc-finger